MLNPQQYSDTQLYNQLRFFASLFDTQKALDATRTPEQHGSLSIRPHVAVS